LYFILMSSWLGCVVGMGLKREDGDATGGRHKHARSLKTAPKRGPKKWVWGPPGRGVLRFWRQAYRNPVHIFEKIAVFSKNVPI